MQPDRFAQAAVWLENARAGDVARTHVADELLAELSDLGKPAPSDVAEVARALDRFYMTTRYPDALAGANPLHVYRAADAHLAKQWATQILTYVERQIEDAKQSQ